MPKKTHNRIRAKMALVSFFLVFGFLYSFLFIHTAQANGISESDVIALTNSSRQKEGLPALVSNAKLAAAAKDKANDMLKNDYFAHTSPKGVDPWYWIKKAGYDYKYAGENLAINYTSAKEQQNAWMNSPTHRANILNTHYQEIGVATVEGKIDGEASILTVELFGTQVLVVADQSRAIVPPVVQPSEVLVPEVKGTEITVSPLSALPAPQLESAVKDDATLSSSWIKTHAQTTMDLLLKKLSRVQWSSVVQITAIVFLMLVVLLSPLTFLYKAIETILQAMRERGVGKEEVLSDTIVLSQSILGTLHQNMKQDEPLILRDIRPG